MARILLILEEYSEMVFLETLLKKLGFDVETARNEVSLGDRLMVFSPDLVIATGEGNRINGARVAAKLKVRGGQIPLLLLFPRMKFQIDPDLTGFSADGAIETPIHPRSAILAVCQLTGINVDNIMAKFEKLPLAQGSTAEPNGIQIISSKYKGGKSDLHIIPVNPSEPAVSKGTKQGGPTVVGPSGKSRADIYKELLKDVPPAPVQTFNRQDIQKEMKEIRKYGEREDVKKMDEERKAFVMKLFKK